MESLMLEICLFITTPISKKQKVKFSGLTLKKNINFITFSPVKILQPKAHTYMHVQDTGGAARFLEETEMKRRREAEMASSEIRSAIEELSLMAVNLKTDGGTASSSGSDQLPPSVHQVPMKPFLSLCNLLIQVLDKIGPTMAVLRQDIHQNIERLEKFQDSDPSTYWDVVEILKKEVKEGKAKQGPTCSKAFVWLTRSLDFTLCLLELLVKDFERNMEQAVEESYNTTLKPWHGWISSAACKVALKLVPDSRNLVNILKSTEDEDLDTLKEQMQRTIELLAPVLSQNHDILKTYGLDKLKST